MPAVHAAFGGLRWTEMNRYHYLTPREGHWGGGHSLVTRLWRRAWPLLVMGKHVEV